MRRAILLLFLLASGSGCLGALRCPGCGNAWYAHGRDDAAYAALATVEDLRESNVTRFREALPFSAPRA